MQEWAEVMYQHQVAGDVLKDLNGIDLQSIGIEAMGARKKILQLTTHLCKQSDGMGNKQQNINKNNNQFMSINQSEMTLDDSLAEKSYIDPPSTTRFEDFGKSETKFSVL